ncbi:MAG: hypothetical protein IJS08_05540, partial [Victivallales bacterium]|nr:hypothetical protein [Victivallales bacterium]
DGPRSWLNMIRQGTTISMEAWSNADKPNQDWNHAWGAAPANVIPRRLCGIRPTASGFSRFVVDPQPESIRKIYCRQPSIHGQIVLELENGRGQLTVPEGTICEYHGKTLLSGKHDI